MRIAFLNPASDADSFYTKMIQFGRLAAADLGVELQVLEARRDLDVMRSLALGLIERSDRPDYLILVNDRSLAAQVLPRISDAGIKTFLATEGFLVAERHLLGKPREKHPNWLGGLLPDDEQAGSLLAESLVAAARARGLVADDGLIHILGLSGAYSIGAILRLNGLRKVVDRHADVVLDEVAPALWDKGTAARLTPELLARNRKTGVVWSASDDMALGAAEAIGQLGRRIGEDILVGGIDWSPYALDKVDRGEFTVSVGGHFLDCAWSVVRLYDHHQGVDFEPHLARSKFAVLTGENSGRYLPFFDESRWSEIRFSRYSRAVDPELADYDLGVDTVLEQL